MREKVTLRMLTFHPDGAVLNQGKRVSVFDVTLGVIEVTLILPRRLTNSIVDILQEEFLTGGALDSISYNKRPHTHKLASYRGTHHPVSA